MNRTEKLDAIYFKIARTWWGTWPWETGYYLPVMIGDVLDWMEERMIWPFEILIIWKTKREPLDKQSDDCVNYIYSLL